MAWDKKDIDYYNALIKSGLVSSKDEALKAMYENSYRRFCKEFDDENSKYLKEKAKKKKKPKYYHFLPMWLVERISSKLSSEWGEIDEQ